MHAERLKHLTSSTTTRQLKYNPFADLAKHKDLPFARPRTIASSNARDALRITCFADMEVLQMGTTPP